MTMQSEFTKPRDPGAYLSWFDFHPTLRVANVGHVSSALFANAIRYERHASSLNIYVMSCSKFKYGAHMLVMCAYTLEKKRKKPPCLFSVSLWRNFYSPVFFTEKGGTKRRGDRAKGLGFLASRHRYSSVKTEPGVWVATASGSRSIVSILSFRAEILIQLAVSLPWLDGGRHCCGRWSRPPGLFSSFALLS